MTDKDKIVALNELLKAVFAQGYRVGASWNNDRYHELFDVNGYLKGDAKIDKDLREKTEILLRFLNLNTDNLIIYTKEDHSIHSGDWDYIAPLIEYKENN